MPADTPIDEQPPGLTSSADPVTAAALPRHRLGALEAAAATSVIVACLVALASMTGLLRLPVQETAGAVPATAGIPVDGGTDARVNLPGNASMPAYIAAAPPSTAATATAANSAVGVESHGSAESAESSSTVQPTAARPAEPADNAISDVSRNGNTTVASAARPHRKHANNSHGRRTHDMAAGDIGRTRHGAGKTREQVTAELMQSKRDGTYPAASETYR